MKVTVGSGADPPGEFIERMAMLLGDELSAFLAASRSPPMGLRLNTLRTEAADFESRCPFEIVPLPYPSDGYSVAADERAGRHPYHAAGVFYLQDPGAMAVGALVGALPGERVLDLAAAPGGKATHLAARMRNVGVLVANDVSRSRALDLVGNVERCGIRSALVTAEAPDRLADRFGAWFDRVLVDAPCSGESMFHKSPAARADWNPAAVQGCARRQADLIRTAARLVRPGGILVYSTCTFSREENEDLIAAFLEEAPDFLPGELEPVPGATPAAIGPAVDGSASATPAAYRLWPHRFPGAGHFVASLRRNEARAGSPARPSRAAGTGRSATAAEVRMVEDFLDDVLPGHDIDLGRVTVRGRKLYERPDPCPDMDGVDVLRPGLELGTVHPRRFEPSHALALAFGADRSPGSVRLSPRDVRLDRFVRGHPIDDPGPAGWVPVAVDDFSLGWGKRVGGVVKNHYPKGLRLHG